MSKLLVLAFPMLLHSLVGCAAPAATPAQTPGCALPAEHAELEKMNEEQLARKMVDVVLGKKMATQIMDTMIDSLAKMPGLQPGFMERFRKNLNPDDLIEMIVPIYQRTYDRETMIAAIEFYQSEQGRKLIEKLPEVTRLGMEVGQQWGRQVARKTLQEMGIPVPETGGS